MTNEKPSYEELEIQIADLKRQNKYLRDIAIFQNSNHENVFKQLAENIDDVFWIRTDEQMIYVNPAFEKIWGFTCEMLYRNPQIFTNSIHLDDKQNVSNIFKSKTFLEQGLFNYDYRIIRNNKEIRWINAKSLPVKDDNGKIIRRVGIARDITEQKENFERIEVLAAMLDVAPNSITVHDINGNFYYANQKTFEIHGYSPNEFLTINLHDLDVPESAALLTERFELIAKQGYTTFEVEHYRKDKTTFPLEIFAKTVRWHGKPAVLSIATDITERKRTKKELINAKEKAEESEYKVRSMFENTQIGILFCDTTGKILEANPAILDILGSPSIEASKSINLLTFKPLHEIGFAQNVAKCISERIRITEDITYTSKWGKTVFMKYYLIPVIITDKVIGVWANLNNLTDLWNTQNELILAKEKAEESDRLKSRFLRNISHEIRTPMNAICGFSDFLLKPNISYEKQKQYTDIVHRSINQLLSVVDNLITISCIETNQLKISKISFNPNKLLLELFEDYNTLQNKIGKSHISLIINIENDNNIILHNDFTRLKQIFSILLDNAFKFTDAGKIEFGYTVQNSKINFFVSDTGIGIPTDKQQIIFKSFTQADDNITQLFGGTGLGLSIAIGLIKLIGAQLTINSEVNKGTKIEFDLSIEQTNQLFDHNVIIQQNGLEKPNLLVAEDEEFNFEYINELLSETNINVIHAINGQKAIEIFKTEKIDIILMDLKMPIMDGFEATKNIRKFNNQVPIIAQTAYSYKREDCINAGFTDYITKPFNDEQLIKMITQYVDK